jgi:hypothetical protein
MRMSTKRALYPPLGVKRWIGIICGEACARRPLPELQGAWLLGAFISLWFFLPLPQRCWAFGT